MQGDQGIRDLWCIPAWLKDGRIDGSPARNFYEYILTFFGLPNSFIIIDNFDNLKYFLQRKCFAF